jgi:hypothetical protein
MRMPSLPLGVLLIWRAGTDFLALTLGQPSHGVLLHAGPNCLVLHSPSGDADDRSNLRRSTCLGLLHCVERRRRLEGLLGQVGDDKLDQLGGGGHTGRSRPASRGGDWSRVRGRRFNSRAVGRGRGPPSASDRLPSTNRRLQYLLHFRLNRLGPNGATAGRRRRVWFQYGMASRVGRTIPTRVRRSPST